jgi:hypothetical protein
MLNKRVATVWVALATIVASQAQATTINVTDSAWQTFDVDPNTAVSGGLEWIDITDGSALDFKFNLASAALVTVVDGGFSGDRFQVFDNGTSLGITSSAPNSAPHSVGLNFDAALASGTYSTASFFLAAGQHDLTGLLAQSALDETNQAIDATVGALRLQPVPLPGAALLFLSGSGAFAAFARRRRTIQQGSIQS